jgi:hypothetical protein
MRGVPVHLAGELRSHPPGRHPLEAVHRGRDGDVGRVPGQQVHVIVCVVELPQLRAEAAAHLPNRVLARPEHVRIEDTAPVRRHADHMHVERGNRVPAAAGCTSIL